LSQNRKSLSLLKHSIDFLRQKDSGTHVLFTLILAIGEVKEGMGWEKVLDVPLSKNVIHKKTTQQV
jgi:hypothetical protein